MLRDQVVILVRPQGLLVYSVADSMVLNLHRRLLLQVYVTNITSKYHVCPKCTHRTIVCRFRQFFEYGTLLGFAIIDDDSDDCRPEMHHVLSQGARYAMFHFPLLLTFKTVILSFALYVD